MALQVDGRPLSTEQALKSPTPENENDPKETLVLAPISKSAWQVVGMFGG